jgi:lipoyl(octanoyl) transferase
MLRRASHNQIVESRHACVCNLGHLAYGEAFRIQRELAERVKQGLLPHILLFVEHDSVLTLGANFHPENLLLTEPEYDDLGIELVKTDRGGDVTFHGPNQLVIYPIFDVSRLGKDLHRWLRDLEKTIILVLADLGLTGYRFPPHTGVWVNGRKVAAIGIKVSRWVSLHGIALNCDNDLSPFDTIVPCGIHGLGVTSLSKEAGRGITIEEARPMVARAFEKVFDLTLRQAELEELMDETPTQTPS